MSPATHHSHLKRSEPEPVESVSKIVYLLASAKTRAKGKVENDVAISWRSMLSNSGAIRPELLGDRYSCFDSGLVAINVLLGQVSARRASEPLVVPVRIMGRFLLKKTSPWTRVLKEALVRQKWHIANLTEDRFPVERKCFVALADWETWK